MLDLCVFIIESNVHFWSVAAFSVCLAKPELYLVASLYFHCRLLLPDICISIRTSTSHVRMALEGDCDLQLGSVGCLCLYSSLA